jgi:ribosomal protein L40E
LLKVNFLKPIQLISNMVKSKEAIARLFTNVFVCKVCKAKRRADPQKVRAGKIKCRKCFRKQLRPKNREAKGGGTGAAGGAAPAAKPVK